MDSRVWTDTASGGGTQLLNKVIVLARKGWNGVAETELKSRMFNVLETNNNNNQPNEIN